MSGLTKLNPDFRCSTVLIQSILPLYCYTINCTCTCTYIYVVYVNCTHSAFVFDVDGSFGEETGERLGSSGRGWRAVALRQRGIGVGSPKCVCGERVARVLQQRERVDHVWLETHERMHCARVRSPPDGVPAPVESKLSSCNRRKPI